MKSLDAVLRSMRTCRWCPRTALDYAERYIRGGQLADLDAIPKLPHQGLSELATALQPLAHWQEEDRRIVRVLVRLGDWSELLEHICEQLEAEPAGADYLAELTRELGTKASKTLAAELLAFVGRYCHASGPNSAGRYLLGCSEAELKKALRKARWHASREGFTELLCRHAPKRVACLLDELFKHGTWEGPPLAVCTTLLSVGGPKHAPALQRLMKKQKDLTHRFRLAAVLDASIARRYHAMAQAAAIACMKASGDRADHGCAGAWLVEHGDKAVRPLLTATMRKRDAHSNARVTILERALALWGGGAQDLAVAGLDSDSETRLACVKALITLRAVAGIEDRLEKIIVTGLAEGDLDQQVAYMGVASQWSLRRVQAGLWAMLHEGRGEKRIRAAAIATLVSLGQEAVLPATKLLAAKAPPARIDAAAILMGAGTAPAAAALEARLENETNEDVRDAILRALDRIWTRQKRLFTRAEISRYVERMAPKLKAPAAAWIKERALPPLRWLDGTALSPVELRYVLCRQARVRNMIADVEAKAVYQLLDSASRPPFVLALLQQFVDAKAEAHDRWVLAMAALLGDDRIVPLLVALIKQWVGEKRGNLAESGVEALALRGSDTALLATESLMVRYRSKMRRVAQAAHEAFEAAAKARDLTPEELGDRVVPWLGFAPGQPWTIGTPKGDVEIRIGPDLKLQYLDRASGTTASAPPRGLSKPAAEELKEAAASLREVAKTQSLRLQNLLVQQRRWPVQRWQELFLGHPVLAALAPRLVWGAYGPDGLLQATFRPLADRTLTTAADEALALSKTGTVGLLHPLEIDATTRLAWQAHLADYEIEPLFPQLNRPVVRVSAAQRDLKRLRYPEAEELHAWTFRGRVEGLAWRRGSISYGGTILSYWKSFATAGIDAILQVHGLYFGSDAGDLVRLGDLFFVPAGTVGFRDYGSQEPQDDTDPRLIPLGQIPPIVFCEALADVGKIAGFSEKVAEGD